MSGTAGAPQISPPSGSQCPAPHLCVGWLLAASGPHLHFAGEARARFLFRPQITSAWFRGSQGGKAMNGQTREIFAELVSPPSDKLIKGCELGRSMKKRE